MKDARIATLLPLLQGADREQIGAAAALFVDSYALRAVVTAAGSSGGDAPPPPSVPKLFHPPLQFEDMYGNRYDNWFDYIQAVTDGDFGRITGLDRDDWEPW